jgi:hypothetical protein
MEPFGQQKDNCSNIGFPIVNPSYPDYTKVPDARVTYHKVVDRSGSRKDPRSFDQNFFFKTLHSQQAKRQPKLDAPLLTDVTRLNQLT